ncbi:MAG TPA: signal peptide peptidase SppA [bacterium]|nr:signal peptide peptidase SppA [bacterium]
MNGPLGRPWIVLAAALGVAGLAWGSLRGGLGGKAAGWAKGLDLGPSRVAVLPINGEIQDSEFTIRWLKHFGHDVRGVKGIVLALDTPGGGVAPSQEICQEIYRLRDDGVVVVASMGNMAASGGYYIASACDEIVADPGTVTGSIGVIMESYHAESLLAKVGVKFETIKSGEFKDSGSFSRPMLPRERALFQTAINDVYDQFVEAVAEGRHDAFAAVLAHRGGRKADSFTEAEVKAYAKSLADGRIYTGRQALDLGLVDSLGGLDDAVDRASELAGIHDPEVITYRQSRSLAEWMTGMSRAEMKAWVHQAFSGEGPAMHFLLR